MKAILDHLNEENGSNFKMSTLKTYADNALVPRVMKMCYDRIDFMYGISKIPEYTSPEVPALTLGEALDFLENELSTRNLTGNAARDGLQNILSNITADNAYVIERVIGRDLKINLGTTNINKIFKGLIKKTPYMRCDIGTPANLKKLDFSKGIISELKADGTYRGTTVAGTEVTVTSRSGKVDEFPVIEAELASLGLDKNFVFTGELTIVDIENRSEANGLINSSNPPHDKIIYDIWDMVPAEEYGQKNGTSLYKDRFEMLKETVKGLDHIRVIEHKMVYSLKEAYEHFQEITKRGLEGTVIKDPNMTWKDGTSKQQLKVKLDIEADVRVTGFVEGNKGSKNEAYFSAVTFETDDGQIKGQVGVTSMTEKIRDWMHENREKIIGSIMEINFNDLTKGRNNDYYACSHPKYTEMRFEKSESDTLERVMETREMAMNPEFK